MHILTTFEWKTFFKELYDKFFETEVSSSAAQVAFYFSFAFFPLLLFLVSLFGMVLDSTDELRRELSEFSDIGRGLHRRRLTLLPFVGLFTLASPVLFLSLDLPLFGHLC